jgi:ribonuclease G
MPKEMVISANPHETRVAILEEGQLCEYYVEREKEFALVGSIYKGRVTRVLPGMQSSFVDIGLDNDAFLYVTDFFEGIEEFEPIVTTVENKAQKMEEEGGEVYAPTGAAPVVEPPDVESRAAAPAGPPEAPPETRAGEEAPGAAPPPTQTTSRPPSERGRFDSRRRPGRDFGRRGGRGRFGRRGGGRGGERRYGRELPPSKYASSRPYEEHAGEPTPPEGYVPIILPGESLAKYKDKVPSEPVSGVTAEEAPVAAVSVSETTAAPQPSGPTAPSASEPPVEQPPAARVESRAWKPFGLEPLPGETLAKWRREEPQAEASSVSTAPPVSEEHEEAEEAPEVHEAEGAHEEHAAELNEGEAAALAEHVAEAQSEEAERQESREDFAAGEAPENHAAESEESEAAGEDSEVTEEEAETESEDRDVHPAESEHGPEAEAEAIAAEGTPSHEEQPSSARVRDDFRARMQHPARRGRRDDRGRRPRHGRGGHHRPQPRRPQLIADLLKQGQEIIVQIAKEPLGKKGARITSHVALPGRYLVYMPTLDHSGVSRKIASAEDRARLRHLVNEAKGSAGGGFIVRTAAGTAAPEEVRADAEFLTRTWAEIKARSEQRKAPSLLHRDLNLVERILRDYVTLDFAAIWVDSEEEYAKVVDFMGRFQPAMVNRVKLYTKETPVFEEFGIQQEIDKGLRPKVWLKSGGYIVINHTEALVAIDVNTGKFVGKGSTRLEDTIVRTNLEAVQEIVRQMRLRDLGGIIVIDFIDMEERRNRDKVLAALEDALRADRAPSKVLRFNEFGLVAITRKRTKQALERTLCQPCPYCTGSGMVKSVPTLCYEIQSEARKMAPEIDAGSLTLRVHPEISKALKTRESALIEELERWTKKSIIIQADPTLHWEQYDIY